MSNTKQHSNNGDCTVPFCRECLSNIKKLAQSADRIFMRDEPRDTKQQIEEIPKELASGWRGWVHDQLDGTSFIASELKEIEEAEKRAVEAIDRLVTEARLSEVEDLLHPDLWSSEDSRAYQTIKNRIAELKSQLTNKEA